MRKCTNILIAIIISMIAFATIAFSDEIFLERENIPSIKKSFPSDPDKFTFAIIGDKTGGGQGNWHIFDRAIEEINELNPDFAITIGDHIQGYIEDLDTIKSMWNEYIEHISKLNIPAFLVPGNHDITNTIMYNYWKENLGKTYYSFDYKGCHFLVLNTEEHQAPDKEAAEKALLDFALNDIQKNREARHFFVFMHKPLWIDSNKWGTIEEALKGIKATVFAGHWHQLMYEKKDDITYIVIGSTGAGITEIEVPQLGVFHHFAMVSVEDREANIAIIKPGNILPENISVRETHQRLRDSWVKFKPEMPLPPITGETVNGKLIATIKNKADKPIIAKISMIGDDDALWKIRPREMVIKASPGEESQSVFELIYSVDSISTHPKYVVEGYYAENLLGRQEEFVSFVDTGAMRKVSEWVTGGTISFPNTEDREAAVSFFTDHKIDDNSSSWQNVSANDKGSVDLDSIYNKPNNTIAYTKTFIYSPKEETIWGAIIADDLATVLVNDREITPLYDLSKWRGKAMFFPISLKAGWNQTMVKSADFTGGWNFTFMLNDPDSQLKFSSQTSSEFDE